MDWSTTSTGQILSFPIMKKMYWATDGVLYNKFKYLTFLIRKTDFVI